jgi:hypothetical protein
MELDSKIKAGFSTLGEGQKIFDHPDREVSWKDMD